MLPAHTKGKDPLLPASVEAGTSRVGTSALMQVGSAPESVHGRWPTPQIGSGSLFHSVSHGFYIHKASQLYVFTVYIFLRITSTLQ